MTIFGTVLHFVTEWTAKNLSYAALDGRLRRSGEHVERKFTGASDIPPNLEAAKHIVGIERWGQRRLRVALGESLVMDEYESYRPETSSSMPELTELFRQTRQETRDLLQRLQNAGVSLEQKIPHNELGETTVRGWFIYLAQHGSRDSMLITRR